MSVKMKFLEKQRLELVWGRECTSRSIERIVRYNSVSGRLD